MTLSWEEIPLAWGQGSSPCIFRARLTHPHADVSFFDIRACLDSVDSLPPQVWDILTGDEQGSARRLRHHADQVRAVLSRYLLRIELAERLGRLPQKLCFHQNAWGKPALSCAHLNFNVSHAGGLIAVCTSSTEIGIDVEPHRAIPEADSILRFFFSQEEISWYARQLQREAAFLTLWTRKEALYKAIGGGLSLPLNFLSVQPGRDNVQGWHIATLLAPTGFHAALAWRRGSHSAYRKWPPGPGMGAATRDTR